MHIETLDHVALWVGDRDRLADFLTSHAGMHVVDRTGGSPSSAPTPAAAS